jgi:hypothetical protein
MNVKDSKRLYLVVHSAATGHVVDLVVCADPLASETQLHDANLAREETLLEQYDVERHAKHLVHLDAPGRGRLPHCPAALVQQEVGHLRVLQLKNVGHLVPGRHLQQLGAAVVHLVVALAHLYLVSTVDKHTSQSLLQLQHCHRVTANALFRVDVEDLGNGRGDDFDESKPGHHLNVVGQQAHTAKHLLLLHESLNV